MSPRPLVRSRSAAHEPRAEREVQRRPISKVLAFAINHAMVLAVASIQRCFRRAKGAPTMSTPILTVAPPGTWNLDPVHSRVDFEVSYLAGTFKGEFHEIGAELTVDAERASLEGTAKVASVDVRDENLSAHLQSPDFFDAERHPELRFSAQDIRLDGDGKVSVDGA